MFLVSSNQDVSVVAFQQKTYQIRSVTLCVEGYRKDMLVYQTYGLAKVCFTPERLRPRSRPWRQEIAEQQNDHEIVSVKRVEVTI